MDFYEVINKRRTIRQFEEGEIPKETLNRILDAGLKAPSSNHLREWEIVTITEKEIILNLANFVKNYPCKYKEPKTPQEECFKMSYPRQKSMVEESACVILPFFKKKYSFDSPPKNFGLMDLGASWALIENILLAATYEGLGTGIHIPVDKEQDCIKEFMKIPYNYYLPAMIMLGYRSEDAEIPKQVEASVEKNVHWNKW